MQTVISLEYLPAVENHKVELRDCGVQILPVKDVRTCGKLREDTCRNVTLNMLN